MTPDPTPERPRTGELAGYGTVFLYKLTIVLIFALLYFRNDLDYSFERLVEISLYCVLGLAVTIDVVSWFRRMTNRVARFRSQRTSE